MRDDGWRRESPIPRATPRPARSPASDYARPQVERVALAIKSDSDEFRPSPCDSDGSSTILANIPQGEISMSEGAVATIDCGFSIEVPMGYRCRVSSLVPGVFIDTVESKRFKVSAVNLGSETILRHGEPIGRLWVEPVHFFEWVTRG